MTNDFIYVVKVTVSSMLNFLFSCKYFYFFPDSSAPHSLTLSINLLIDLQALLHFMYWDSLPDFEELTGSSSRWASTVMFQHLLAAADQYGLERLRLLCEASLCDSVAIDTVSTTLALAEQHHCFQLKSVCLKFVAMPKNLRGESGTHNVKYSSLICK